MNEPLKDCVEESGKQFLRKRVDLERSKGPYCGDLSDMIKWTRK